MAFSVKSAVSSRVAASKARSSVRAEALNGEKALLSVASAAAAACLLAPSADAGVILAQPQLKKAFQDDGPAFIRSESGIVPVQKAAPAAAAAPATKAEPAGKAVSETVGESGGIDPRALALPGAIGFIGALGFIGSKVDEGFDDFIKNSMTRDSNVGALGVGYENVIKSTYGGIYGEPTAKGTKKGTKKGFF